MRRITSIDRAIKYFRDGSTVSKVKTRNGEFESVEPPVSFRRMYITKNEMTFMYYHIQWYDYAEMLESQRDEITKLAVYYEA